MQYHVEVWYQLESSKQQYSKLEKYNYQLTVSFQKWYVAKFSNILPISDEYELNPHWIQIEDFSIPPRKNVLLLLGIWNGGCRLFYRRELAGAN